MSESPKPVQQQTVLGFLASLFNTYKWPSWAALLITAFCLIPDWESRFVFWTDMLRKVGGHAEMVAGILPYIPGALGIFGIVYLVISVVQEESGRARPWMPLAGWTVISVFVIVFGSLALFVDFVQSSNIPAAMAYLAEKGSVRKLSEQQSSRLKEEVQKIKDKIPELNMIAERSVENLQYASELFDVLKSVGVKFMTSGKEQVSADASPPISRATSSLSRAIQF